MRLRLSDCQYWKCMKICPLRGSDGSHLWVLLPQLATGKMHQPWLACKPANLPFWKLTQCCLPTVVHLYPWTIRVTQHIWFSRCIMYTIWIRSHVHPFLYQQNWFKGNACQKSLSVRVLLAYAFAFRHLHSAHSVLAIVVHCSSSFHQASTPGIERNFGRSLLPIKQKLNYNCKKV